MFINNLRNNKSIVIKLADKGLGMTLLPRQWYEHHINETLYDVNKTYTQLNDASLHKSINNIMSQKDTIVKLLNDHVNHYYSHQHNTTIHSYIKYINAWYERASTQDEYKLQPAHLYLLPKVHKLTEQQYQQCTSIDIDYQTRIKSLITHLKSRPIASNVNSYTTPLSQVCALLLNNYIKQHDNILLDTISLVQSLEQNCYPQTDNDLLLISFDVESLYTNLPIHKSIMRVIDHLTSLTGKNDPRQIDLIKIIKQILITVLNNNIVTYNNKYYRQVKGIAMGTNLAPPFANLVLHTLESPILSNTNSNKPILYRRYIDDGLILTYNSNVQQELTRLYDQLQLTLTWNVSNQHIEFLDLVIHKHKRYALESKLDIRSHEKLNNRHLFLTSNSFHRQHVLYTIIGTELKRNVRNNTDENEFNKYFVNLYQWMRARKFKHNELAQAFNKYINVYNERTTLLQRQSTRVHTTKHTSYFALPFDPITNKIPINQLLKNIHYMISDITTTHNGIKQNLFTTPPIVAYKRARTLASYLISKYA